MEKIGMAIFKKIRKLGSSKSNANRNLWASFLVGVHFKAQTLSAVRLTKEPYHVYSTPSLPPNGLKQPQCKTK